MMAESLDQIGAGSIDVIGVLLNSAQDAAEAIAISTAQYWHQTDRNEIHEQNFVGYFAIAIYNSLKGQDVVPSMYFEATHPTGGLRNDSHIDLMVLGPRGDWLIAMEAKRLFNTSGAESIVLDVEKLGRFKLLSGQFKSAFPGQEEPKPIRVVVSATWDDRIAAWWDEKNQERESPNHTRPDTAVWKALFASLNAASIRRSIPIRKTKDEKESHHLLIAIWDKEAHSE